MNRFACLLGCAAIAIALPLTPVPARAQTIAEARKVLAARYVLPETAAKLDAALGAAEKRGEFKGLAGEALADKINAVLRTVTADGHLNVGYNPARSAAMLAEPPRARDEEEGEPPAEYVRELARANAGVERLERLPGNIRYMDYRGFMWGTPDASASIENAMEFLRGGDAVIIDLRRNGGGSAEAVAALVSYFLPAGTELMRFEERGQPGEISKTSATPFSLAGKPLYVLTSKGTFSAAEEFSDHISAFKLGTLIGENTGGGGFNNTFVPLPGGLVMSVSVGRAVHMVTGKDWEQVGIAPAIAVPADQALTRAQAEAMTALAAAAPEGEKRGAERLAAFYRAQATPVNPGHALSDYTGKFGPRTIALDANGALTTQRGEGPRTRLIAVGPDLFVPETNPTQYFRFVPGESALDVDGPDGTPVRTTRAAG